ncbi:hypothetical protein GCM10011506_18270 [Marivirga lumbricoides]|uniref:DUF3891 domain-containing protein n=1 Tax=Marivirga lumbricoides TaxID=1046115 RepID=A0ABQ1M3N6_9BACT|nr:hypothetical protein GCM10011506_18270 [Marivirga lumbricoides]
MIVNHTAEGWEIITQRSHGLLAGQICAQWKKENRPPRWFDTLIATTEHDDAHNELDKEDLLEENGGPKDYKMKSHRRGNFDPEYCDNLLKMAITKGLYITLLIAKHIHFLYEGEKEAQSYCEKLKKKEKVWLKQAGCTRKDVDKSYRLLELCDAFSLLICEQKLPPEGRRLEISKGPDGKMFELYQNPNKHIVVYPWPFEEDSFIVNYEVRLLDQLAFKNNAEFLKVFRSVPVENKMIRIVKEAGK